ncbi:MAG: RnfABCDGE type electron transport complex subunit D, partial [Bacteroidia bacterium]|nr:RnfABCDGE type electron transport complex subunit D [Bacteroidia bacterium]
SAEYKVISAPDDWLSLTWYPIRNFSRKATRCSCAPTWPAAISACASPKTSRKVDMSPAASDDASTKPGSLEEALLELRSGIDAVTSATPLGIIKEGISGGMPVSEISKNLPSTVEMLFGEIGGSLGEISALLLILGGLYLLIKKVITWHIPVSVIGTVALVAAIFWLVNPEMYIHPVYHILTGGLMLGAIFMATDMVSSPMNPKGQIIYGIGIGLITISIRMFGAYPEGISFAILIMNAFTPLINTYVKPKRFGGN